VSQARDLVKDAGINEEYLAQAISQAAAEAEQEVEDQDQD
jgi:hypothetical protein